MTTDEAGHQEQDDVQDLIGFLSDKRMQMRLLALDIIKGLTASPEGIERLKAKMDALLPALLRLVPVPDPQPQASKASEESLICLVNLSQDAECAVKLLGLRVIGRVMDYMREDTCPHCRLMTMLLCNLTVSDQGCQELLQLGQARVEGLNMAVLIKKFVVSGMNFDEGTEDPYEHVAGVLTNVTRLAPARQLLLQPGRGLLQALVSQLGCPGEMRRRGCAGAIKNCCIEAEKDKTLEAIVADEMVLKRMLRCLDGEEPKEKDAAVREAIAESLLALASTKEGRDALWKVKAPECLRKGYEFEESPEVCRAMEHAAELLITHQEEGPDQLLDMPQQEA